MAHTQSRTRPKSRPPLSACGLALLDAEGRLEWVNERLAGMLGMNADALTGKKPEQLPTQAQAWFAGDGEPIQQVDAQGQMNWLTTELHTTAEKSLLVVHDMTIEQQLRTENRYLRDQLEDLKLSDDLTGLPNRRAITQALELQISRSRRYKNPLSVVLVHIGLHDDQVQLLRGSTEPLVLAVSRFLRDRLRWVDQIGRWEENIFLLVLPETEQTDAGGLVHKLGSELGTLEFAPPLNAIKPVLSFGVGVWHRGDDLRTLLHSASQDLAAN